MPANLSIHPTKPFKSSRLALPPSPFSPLFPLTPPPAATTSIALPPPAPPQHPLKDTTAVDLPPPPPEPLHWLWQCHLCNRVYKLGTTRRCLEDGHLFCSGTTTVKRSHKHAGKKVVRHKACASEFDYARWKAWGVWRRDVGRRIEEAEGDVRLPLFAPSVPSEGDWFSGAWAKKGEGRGTLGEEYWKKDCWGTCDYPSECRWGKQYGVVTPTLPPAVPEKDASYKPKTKTKFEDILLTIPELGADGDAPREDGDGDKAMQSPPLSPELPESLEEPTKQPSFDDLLESVKRRKRRSSGAIVDVPSPLASHPPSPTTISMAEAMDLAASFSSSSSATVEHVEDIAHGGRNQTGEAGPSALQRAFDDFDLEFRRGFERAGQALTGFVSAVRSTAALEEERAEMFVKGLKAEKGRKR